MHYEIWKMRHVHRFRGSRSSKFPFSKSAVTALFLLKIARTISFLLDEGEPDNQGHIHPHSTTFFHTNRQEEVWEEDWT
jgi:hypothetical protein